MSIRSYRNITMVLGTLLALVLALPSQAQVQRFKPGNQTIAEIAITDGNFDTLVAALACTGLVPAVADPEAELTVFAPTDAAFAQLGLNAMNICSSFSTETLSGILLYHAVGERRPSPSVVKGRNKAIMTLAGAAIYPEGRGSLTIVAASSTATIERPDILASNGIIHTIDYVLLP